jgi:hypothetical protein
MKATRALQEATERLAEAERWTARLRGLQGRVIGGWAVLRASDCFDALDMPLQFRAGAHQRLGDVLRALGWAAARMQVDGDMMRVWRRPADYAPVEQVPSKPEASPFREPLPEEPVALPTVISSGMYSGSIPLNGEDVPLASDLGKKLVLACCLLDEGLLSVQDLLLRFDMTETAWDDLRFHRDLQKSVRALIDHRAQSGVASSQKAVVYSGHALDTLKLIHQDRQVPASSRAAAAATIVKAGSVGGGLGAGGAVKPGLAPSGGPWLLMKVDGRVISGPPENVEPVQTIEMNLGGKNKGEA